LPKERFSTDQANSKDLGEEVKRIALSQGFKVLKSTGNKNLVFVLYVIGVGRSK